LRQIAEPDSVLETTLAALELEGSMREAASGERAA
jgi:hypothetical protein